MSNSKTPLSPQITDAVTPNIAKVIGEGPAIAMDSLYQAMAHSLAILFENSVSNQQNMSTIAQATTSQGVAMIYSIGTAADAAASVKIIDGTKK